MKNWISILMVVLCLAGCAPMENTSGETHTTPDSTPTEDIHGENQATTGCTQTEEISDENRTILSIDPTKGSPFNNGKFEGWGACC